MTSRSRIIQGIGVSPGIAIGKAYVLDRSRVPILRYQLADEAAISAEVRRFKDAVARAESDLEAIKQSIGSEFKDHLHLLEVQKMILRDRSIYDESLRSIKKEKLNAQMALMKSLSKARELFNALNDEYVKSRIADVDSAGDRVLRILSGQDQGFPDKVRERVILVARELAPADAIQLQVSRTLGVVTEIGGRTSHSSIIARSLSMPAVVAAENATRLISMGDLLIIDGASGKVIVNPEEKDLSYYADRQLELESYLKEITRKAHLPATTKDAYPVRVEANIELLEEIVAVKDNGAESIGLYRTEFFFMNRTGLPDEDTLYKDYRDLSELMAPNWVTIRSLDLGAEKLSAWYPAIHEANPALGLRSIRLCLYFRDLFKTQLRAI